MHSFSPPDDGGQVGSYHLVHSCGLGTLGVARTGLLAEEMSELFSMSSAWSTY